MDKLNTLFSSWGYWTLAMALFGASFHVLITLNVGGTHVRVGSSDILLPVLTLMLAWKWRQDGFPSISWRINGVWIWLVVLTAWVMISLVNGRLQTGEWIIWAFVNKGIGWLVLLGYLLAGGWIGNLLTQNERDTFTHAFILSGWAVCLYSLGLFFTNLHYKIFGFDKFSYERPTGFAENPNAFSITIAVIVVFGMVHLSTRNLLPRIYYIIGTSIALSVQYFSFSRSAMLGLAICFSVLMIVGLVQIRNVIIVLLSTIGIITMVLVAPPIAKSVISEINTSNLSFEIKIPGTYARHMSRKALSLRSPNNSERVKSTIVAFDEWKQAPLMGIGLGSYYLTYRDVDKIADTIHNTSLWILTEMGLIGFFLFGGLFFVVVRGLYLASRNNTNPLPAAAFGTLLVYGGASVGTEIMYQRPLWFIMGLALAIGHTTLAGDKTDLADRP